MAVMGELHAELMPASGLRANFEPGEIAMHAAALIVQKRLPGAFRLRLEHVNAMRLDVLAQPIFERAGFPLHLPLDDRPVNLLDGPLAKLLAEPGGRLAGAREEHDSGDRLVEAMDDTEKDLAGLLVLVLDVF